MQTAQFKIDPVIAGEALLSLAQQPDGLYLGANLVERPGEHRRRDGRQAGRIRGAGQFFQRQPVFRRHGRAHPGSPGVQIGLSSDLSQARLQRGVLADPGPIVQRRGQFDTKGRMGQAHRRRAWLQLLDIDAVGTEGLSVE